MAEKSSEPASPKPKRGEPKPIGEVTHFYSNLGVAIVKFNKKMDVGTRLKFKGATTDFEEEIKSMQYDHKDIQSATKGQEVGIKVGDKVREGDQVFKAE
jgi:translation initiation factor IF-2